MEMIEMANRKYSKCLWCGKTIDITNNDNELCSECAKYPSQRAMILAESKEALKWAKNHPKEAEKNFEEVFQGSDF